MLGENRFDQKRTKEKKIDKLPVKHKNIYCKKILTKRKFKKLKRPWKNMAKKKTKRTRSQI